MRTCFISVMALCSLLINVGRGAADEIKLGYLPLLGGQGLHAAELDAFKRAGLDVAAKPFQSGPALAQALIAGDYQVGELGLVPMLNSRHPGRAALFPGERRDQHRPASIRRHHGPARRHQHPLVPGFEG